MKVCRVELGDISERGDIRQLRHNRSSTSYARVGVVIDNRMALVRIQKHEQGPVRYVSVAINRRLNIGRGNRRIRLYSDFRTGLVDLCVGAKMKVVHDRIVVPDRDGPRTNIEL